MAGTIPVDKDGKALRRALIWLDARAEKEAEILKERTQLPFITGKSPSSKVLWIKRNEPEIFAKTYKMLDCKDYVQARMTGEYGTDFSCAFAMTYFNPEVMGWWTDVLAAMEITEDLLPTPMPSTQVVGKLKPEIAQELGLLAGTPVVSGGGDVPLHLVSPMSTLGLQPGSLPSPKITSRGKVFGVAWVAISKSLVWVERWTMPVAASSGSKLI
jgi:xylulokinase